MRCIENASFPGAKGSRWAKVYIIYRIIGPTRPLSVKLNPVVHRNRNNLTNTPGH